jgi:hypothetical protein
MIRMTAKRMAAQCFVTRIRVIGVSNALAGIVFVLKTKITWGELAPRDRGALGVRMAVGGMATDHAGCRSVVRSSAPCITPVHSVHASRTCRGAGRVGHGP